MNNYFADLYRYFEKRKVSLKVFLILIVLLCAILSHKLIFAEYSIGFLPQNASNEKLNLTYQHLGTENKIVVNFKEIFIFETPTEADEITTKEKNLLTDAVTFFAEYLSKNDSLKHIKHLYYGVNKEDIEKIEKFVVSNMPFFLSDDDYSHIDTLLTLQNIENQIKNNKQLMHSSMDTSERNVFAADPLHFSNNIIKRLRVFQTNEMNLIKDSLILNQEGYEALVTITSSYSIGETALNRLLIHEIEKAVEATMKTFENKVEITFFGESLISISNAEQIKKDSYLVVILSVFFILALLIYFFRGIKSLFLIIYSVLFGVLFALGVIVLFKSTISIIALGAASIVIGIAVNYPIHFLTLYKREKNTILTLKGIVNPLIIGNITTIGAFLSLSFINADAMKDWSLFASLLLVGTILFVLVFMPHFLGKRFLNTENYKPNKIIEKIISFEIEKNRDIIAFILLLTVLFFIFSFKTSFETNMHAINYMTKEQRQFIEESLIKNGDENKTIYCISEGNTPDEALKYYEISIPIINKLHADSLIIKYSGIGNYLPSIDMQQTKITQWNKFWENRRENLLANIHKTALNEEYKTELFSEFESILTREYNPQTLDYFDIIKENLSYNYLLITPHKSFVFTILQILPENKNIVEFTLNNIDHNIFTFNNASITEKLVSALSDDFYLVLFICAIIVFIFLLFSFGRIELAIMAFIPLVVAWIWILGIMGIFGIKFNIVNIILATFIFGQGADYTILITEGIIYEYTYRKKMLDSFKKSILLSSSVMILSIGMLIFSKHPAMRSLAEVTMVGMVSVLFITYIFPPLVFKILTTRRNKNRISPITFWDFTKTIVSFLLFFFIVLFLLVSGFFLLTIGKKTKRNKEKFHKLLCNSLHFYNRIMIQIPVSVVNQHSENFEKPSIIICNHLSKIDFIYTLMQYPKIIILTNKKVWKNPFYGLISRYADYFPILNKVEKHIDKLKELVTDGYSILIFPERKNKLDCSMGTFDEGAFYLADKLNLDLLPIVIYGTGNILPQKEFILRKGKVYIEILRRIKPNNPIRKKTSILETTKITRNLFIEQYKLLADNIETPDYFYSQVYHNYIYKGIKIEQRAKKNLSHIRNYTEIISLLPNEGNILIISCGQGELALLCALVKKNAFITAIDSNPELLAIAKNCVSVPKNLHYCESIKNHKFFDVFVLNDPTEVEQEWYMKFNKPVFCVDF